MSTENRRCTAFDCSSLNYAADCFSAHGIPVLSSSALDEYGAVSLKGHGTLLRFFTDPPLPLHLLQEAEIQRVIVAGPSAGAVNDPTGLIESGIELYDTPGLTAHSVAEFTLIQMMNLARGVFPAQRALVQGLWRPQLGRELSALTLGLYGFGAVAQSLTQMAKAQGMNILVHASPTRAKLIKELGACPCSEDQLLAQSDVVSVHKRLIPGQAPLLDAARLARMKSTSFVVNTARAALIDQEALLSALQKGQLAGAALDVFEAEPTGALELAAQQDLNLLLSPHMAWLTQNAVQRLVGAASAYALGRGTLARRVH